MSALTNLLSHRELIENLVMRDIKARYKQSALGITWAVLNPLCMALIYNLVGGIFFKQDTGIPFTVFAYFGLLFWNLFSSGVVGATESLVAHLALITKVYFPREVFPLSAVLGKLVDFGFGLVGLIPLVFIYRLPVQPAIVLLLPLIVIQVLFTAGLGMLMACANLFYRDVRHIIGLVMAVWLYLVPNLYPLEVVPERLRPLYLCNPIASVIDTARRLAFPTLGGDIAWKFVCIAAVVSCVTFVVGYTVFKRYEPRFAESI